MDEFLHEHRNAAGLEEMRDDLGIYLKVLRSAMIELINEDYVDFVNLASNLVGLDQSINSIQTSLGQLKEEIIMIKQMLLDTMSEVSECMAEKLLLKSYLKSIHSVGKVYASIAKLEHLLKPHCSNNDDDDDDEAETNSKLQHNINSIILERSSLEMVQLEFNMQFCKEIFNDNKNSNIVDKVNVLHNSLMEKIQKYFLNAFNTNNSDSLELCLRVYCTLNECETAENIFRINIVSPYMHKIISEVSLQNSPQGLYGIYKQILQFLETKLQLILRLTLNKKDFNFLINSCWTEIERRLETQMSSIFAPGNPDMFYQKYQHTMEFLHQFELIIGNNSIEIMKWHKHAQYQNFQTRWNLPVYFQIRFQEIGSEIEEICSKTLNDNNAYTNNNNGEFKLKSFDTTWKCITKCWSTGVYLSEIFIRFWTFTLQLISRICSWIDDSLTADGLTNKIDFYVAIHLDVQRICGNLSKLVTTIYEKSPSNIKTNKDGRKLLEKCFDESVNKLNERLKNVERCIEREILNKSLPNIRQVSDIPRLYRKTNKDIPTKACGYVEQILDTPKLFYRQYNEQWNTKLMISFLTQVFSAINEK